MLSKYWQIFKISFEQEFAYKVNFIMWRIRNIIQILLIYFLWTTVFNDPGKVVFGYDRAKILSYVFGLMLVRAFVFSSRAIDVSGDIARGDLSNYLLKPLNYFKYWFTRDIASKSLNLMFAALEFIILFAVLRPEFFIQTNALNLLLFILSLLVANVIYFTLVFMVSSIPFWAPELGWGSHFLVTVVVAEFLSGSLFPIDVLPGTLQKIILSLPFPYLLYFPIQIYLGKIDLITTVRGLAVAVFWMAFLMFVMKAIWKAGLKAYQATGR